MRLYAALLVVSIGAPALAQRNVPSTPPADASSAAASAPAAPPALPSTPVTAPALVDAPRVVLETTKGTIVIEVYPDKAPLTVANFLEYVDRRFYNGTILHRVIPGFMVQGGGFTKDYSEKPARAPVKNESNNGLSNQRGTIAMARTADPDSATSQFFFNLVPNEFLDWSLSGPGYTVFGKVLRGMAVLDTIAEVPTICQKKEGKPCKENLPPGLSDVPKEPIVILKIYRQK
jgi:peptidyl-prolyl cis-trans isomerase A (cyclophilin A)